MNMESELLPPQLSIVIVPRPRPHSHRLVVVSMSKFKATPTPSDTGEFSGVPLQSAVQNVSVVSASRAELKSHLISQ